MLGMKWVVGWIKPWMEMKRERERERERDKRLIAMADDGVVVVVKP
jgi:hypothetical protein